VKTLPIPICSQFAVSMARKEPIEVVILINAQRVSADGKREIEEALKALKESKKLPASVPVSILTTSQVDSISWAFRGLDQKKKVIHAAVRKPRELLQTDLQVERKLKFLFLEDDQSAKLPNELLNKLHVRTNKCQIITLKST